MADNRNNKEQLTEYVEELNSMQIEIDNTLNACYNDITPEVTRMITMKRYVESELKRINLILQHASEI